MAKANLMERRLTSDLFIDYENKNIYDNVKNAQLALYSMAMREHYYDKVKYMSPYTMPTPIMGIRTMFNNMGKLFK